MNYFGVTNQNLKQKLNPLNDKNGFLGSNSSLNQDEINSVVANYSEYVIDRLPPRYKKLTSYIDGEIIFGKYSKKGYSVGGETEFFLGMKNVSNVKVYVNYNKNKFDERLPEDEEQGITVDGASGKVTLANPLPKHSSVYVTYFHDNMENCGTLKLIAINLIVADIALTLYTDEIKLSSFLDLRQQAYVDLQRIRESESEGKLNLKFFDDLELLEETLNDRQGLPNIGQLSRLGMR